MSTIAVMGATGRTGATIARKLLAQGVRVRALARSRDSLMDLERLGAETLAGQASDARHLTRAFEGADAIYTLMPHDPTAAGYLQHQRRQGEAMAQAVRDSGVRRVVHLSSLGADQATGTGLIVSLHEQELRLKAIEGLDLLLLRPGAFFETYLAALPSIRATGVLADALAPDLKLPMLATADIAEAAAQALIKRDWRGTIVRELLGPRDLSSREVAHVLGVRLGLPDLPYVQLPCDDMAHALVEAGFAPDFAELLVAMSRGMNDGTIRSLQGRSAQTATPTSFERYADEIAAAWARL
ncbi:NAD(P)H-binding protein [Variovorax sp. J22R133]|uniref:NmrA family NAD(P)-binding protein n=1 Tax=Variovorax brevis TaxID=3053503 RepID=UPI002577D4FC|nr:NAD(P)H-binding protein [Variovorax sp. J22R133]MDM0111261.1 NAD(P)H-binding protein [Variovorax sp. J22R133]